VTRAVVFDLDGTLVDSPSGIVRTFTAAFSRMEVTGIEPAAIRATIGIPLEQAFGKLMGIAADDDRVVTGVRHYKELFREIVLPTSAQLVFPGVPEGLAALRERGCALAVATSKFYASADALLTAAGLRAWFTVVVGADQVARPKPAPDSGELVLRELGVSADEAVMVGDTTHDLRMARAAGMRSIGVTYGVHSREELMSAEPTWLADTFDEVVRCVPAALPRN
jgi:phosphoglycolate phosphatase